MEQMYATLLFGVLWWGVHSQQLDWCSVSTAEDFVDGLESTACTHIEIEQSLDFGKSWGRELGGVVIKTNKTVRGKYKEDEVVRVDWGLRFEVGNTEGNGWLGLHFQDISLEPGETIALEFERLHMRGVVFNGKIRSAPEKVHVYFDRCILEGSHFTADPPMHYNNFGNLQPSSEITRSQMKQICGECLHTGMVEIPMAFSYIENISWTNELQRIHMVRTAIKDPEKQSIELAEDGGDVAKVLSVSNVAEVTIMVKGKVTLTDRDLLTSGKILRLGEELQKISFRPYIRKHSQLPTTAANSDRGIYPLDPHKTAASIIFEISNQCAISRNLKALKFVGLVLDIPDIGLDSDMLLPCFFTVTKPTLEMAYVFYIRMFSQKREMDKFVDIHFPNAEEANDESYSQQESCSQGRLVDNEDVYRASDQGSNAKKDLFSKTYFCLNHNTSSSRKVLTILVCLGVSIAVIVIVLGAAVYNTKRKNERVPRPGQTSDWYSMDSDLLEVTNYLLGGGSDGDVTIGRLKPLEGKMKEVAVKETKPQSFEALQREIFTLRAINHENIVDFYGAIYCTSLHSQLQAHKRLVVIERMEKSLKDLIYRDQDFYANCKYRDLLYIFKSIASGLSHLHSKNFIHFDIKPGNVLISKDPAAGLVVKISDFGWAKEGDDVTATFRGTEYYMAPEVVRAIPALPAQPRPNFRVNKSLDVYSFGVLMLECVMRCEPISMSEDNGPTSIRVPAVNGIRNMRCDCHPCLRELIQTCLQYDATSVDQNPPGIHHRPACSDLLSKLEDMLGSDLSGSDWLDKLPPAWTVRNANE